MIDFLYYLEAVLVFNVLQINIVQSWTTSTEVIWLTEKIQKHKYNGSPEQSVMEQNTVQVKTNTNLAMLLTSDMLFYKLKL